MALSHPRTTALVLAVLVSMAMGVPHQDRHGSLDVVPPVAAEANSMIHVEVGPRGEHIMRRDASLTASLADTHAAHAGNKDDPSNVMQDGAVTVVEPAGTSSEQVKLEELTEECMMEEPTAECMEKFGSYGIRKLFTETFENIQKLKLTRNGWMSHPTVQKRKLFDLTLPGSVNSGTYAVTGDNGPSVAVAPYGLVSQNLNLYHQLELGIRVFDIRVSYSAENELVYISHGALMVPIAQAMKDVRRYLEEHTREVVILDVKKDPNGDSSHQKSLLDEEKNPKRVPGQLVHEAIGCEMKDMLATYHVLNKLNRTEEMAENPTVGALVDAGGQVVYFWEGQQVLCTTFQECSLTPGWHPQDAQAGSSLAFGTPLPLGTRVNTHVGNAGSKTTNKSIEPGCLAPSQFYTTSSQPEELLSKIHAYSLDLSGMATKSIPKCFPVGGKLPSAHSPTLWYTVDASVTPTDDEQSLQTDRMSGVKAIYTRGEGFTVKTEAERTNYLLLSWFLKRHDRELFTRPNAIMMEFASAGSMPIIRIIEAMQERPDCGWAIYCKESGSCWANTLLGPKDECLDEALVAKELKIHADGAGDVTSWIIYTTICIGSVALLCFLSGITKFILKTVTGPKKPAGFEKEEATAVEEAAEADLSAEELEETKED